MGHYKFSRRRFLKTGGVIVGGLAAASLTASERIQATGAPPPPPVSDWQWPFLTTVWQDPQAMPGASVASQLQYAATHFAGAAGGVTFFNGTVPLNNGYPQQLKRINPNVVCSLYTFPTYLVNDGSQPWVGAFRQQHEESWYLHNPEGSTSPADRVFRYPSSDNTAITEYIMDVRNLRWQSFIQQQILRYAQAHPGITEVYHDGMSMTTELGGLNWAHAPSSSAVANWFSWAFPYLQNLRNFLRQQGYTMSVNSNDSFRNEQAKWVDDSPLIPVMDATGSEYFYAAYFLDENNQEGIQVNWQYWQQRAIASMNAGKNFSFTSGISGRTGSPAAQRWMIYALASWALWHDGSHGSMWWASGIDNLVSFLTANFGWPDKHYLGSPVAGSQGAIGGFVNGDGNHQRTFSKRIVLVNPTGSTTRNTTGVGPSTFRAFSGFIG